MSAALKLAPRSEVTLRPLRASEVSNRQARLDLAVVVEPGEDTSADFLARYVRENLEDIRAALRERGCVLFRGFDVDAGAFERVVGGALEVDRFVWMLPTRPRLSRWLLNLPLFGGVLRWLLGHIEAAVTRRRLPGDKLSLLPQDNTVQFPHHEYGIFFNVPKVVAFHCQQETPLGGETILCDGEAAWEGLEPRLKGRFARAEGIRYRDENQRFMPAFTAPALLSHPDTGQVSLNYTGYRHETVARVAREHFPGTTILADQGDDVFMFTPRLIEEGAPPTELTEEETAEVVRAHLAHSVLLRWRKGDVLLVDNFKVLHARLNSGNPRRSLAVLLADYVHNEGRTLF